MVTDQVKKTIMDRSLIAKGDHVIVGVSGGPDSVCLLHVLCMMSKEWEINIHAVHINHLLRGEDADKDQAYTEKLCRDLSVPCRVFAYDVKKMASFGGLTTEEMGRNLRYEAFDQVREEILLAECLDGKTPRVRIAVAQNQNDQAETVLMRILRGTGTDGLAGMDYERDGKIIRPLLDVTREEIEAYCETNHLTPRIDQTNLEPIYVRNRIRLELIPYLKEHYNKEILSALDRLVRISNEDKDFLYRSVEEALGAESREGSIRTFPRKIYRELHPAIRKRVILRIFRQMGLIQDVVSTHLLRADQLILQGDSGERMEFPKGYLLRITYDKAEFINGKEDPRAAGRIEGEVGFCYSLGMDEITNIPGLNASFKIRRVDVLPPRAEEKNHSSIVYLDLGDSNNRENLVLRSRRTGDYLTPLGMKGTKKLQDFFVDEKIRREERDLVPLLCLGSEVLWVVGHRINENYKVGPETKEIIALEYIRSL